MISSRRGNGKETRYLLSSWNGQWFEESIGAALVSTAEFLLDAHITEGEEFRRRVSAVEEALYVKPNPEK